MNVPKSGERAGSGLVNRDDVAELRSRIGSAVHVRGEPYLTEVTRDAVRHWADATGDRNPLWRDTAYARRFGHPDMLAPPAMLYAFSKLSIGYRGGLPGVHSFFAGTHWTWHRPVPRGTCVDVAVVFKDLIEHTSTFAEVSFQQVSDVAYTAGDGSRLADARAWGMRVSRASARNRERSRPVPIATYTPDDIDRIADEYASEHVRTEPLDPQSVRAGDGLPSIVRGPYTVTTAVAFEQAWGGLFIQAHGPWYEYLRRHPAAGLPNTLGVPEPPEAVHWDRDIARMAGLPEPYDYGPERIAWLAVLLTNWMGPTSLLHRLDVEVRRFNFVGDLTRCHGTVAAVRPVDGHTAVDIDVWTVNQRGERTATGTVEIRVPPVAGEAPSGVATQVASGPAGG